MTGRRRVLLAVAASALAAVSPVPAWAQVNNVAVTKHNLSVTGPGGIHSSNETEICVFCHTPHAGSPVVPLWNHDTSRTTYQMYQSTSFQAQSGGPYLPNGSSVLCLSCHDGTVAVAALRGRTQPTMTGTAAGGYLPTGASNLGANLRDDHPFSFPYTRGREAAVRELPRAAHHLARLPQNGMGERDALPGLSQQAELGGGESRHVRQDRRRRHHGGPDGVQ
jgi:hypothetical protein